MRLVSTLLLCLLGGSSLAAECDRWAASMQEEEVGPLMTASICARISASAPEAEHLLLVQCAGEGHLWMRYLPFADGGYPPGGDEEFKTEMQFSLDPEKFSEPARYEAMDGAMAMDTTVDAPLIKAMTSGKQLVLSDVKNKVPAATFTLNGADEAMEKLIEACKP